MLLDYTILQYITILYIGRYNTYLYCTDLHRGICGFPFSVVYARARARVRAFVFSIYMYNIYLLNIYNKQHKLCV